jgi:hypothetical protein
MSDASRLEHERIVATLERRLTEVGRYDKLFRHWEYCKGECDLVAVRGNVWTYYECKCHYSPVTVLKACDQFRRARTYNRGHNWKFVYVTPTHVERMRV